jgi:YD repeat-containing protein
MNPLDFINRGHSLARVLPRCGLLAILMASAIGGFAVTPVQAQQTSMSPQDETPLLVKADDTLSAQGDQSLGDTVDLYTGSLSFHQTDISLPGNSTLPVAVTRRFDSASLNFMSAEVAASLAFEDWQIDLPRIETTLAAAQPWPSNRCTTNWMPSNVTVGAYTWGPSQYWQGFNIDLPGSSAVMLVPSANVFPNPASPSNFVWVAADSIGVTCTTATTVAGAAAGDGFVVWLPDGTSYTFNLLATYTGNTLVNQPGNADPGGLGSVHALPRIIEMMLATRATDRFGNTVNYTYNNQGQIQSIIASDGRALSFQWSNGFVIAVCDGATCPGSRMWS